MSKVEDKRNADSIVKAIHSKQETRTVKYTDYHGHKKSRKVVLTNPGTLVSLHAVDLMEKGNDQSDYVALYNEILKSVISNPRLSFEKQDKDIPKSLRTKDVPAVNRAGKHVTLHMKFPDVRTAVNMVSVMAKPSGASNLVETLKALDGYVFKDGNGRAVSEKYWDAGHTGDGLALNAINAARVYLAKVLDFNGFSSVVEEGISFLMDGVHQD